MTVPRRKGKSLMWVFWAAAPGLSAVVGEANAGAWVRVAATTTARVLALNRVVERFLLENNNMMSCLSHGMTKLVGAVRR